MLADIGLSPGDARIEASRWAWDLRPTHDDTRVGCGELQ
jgi:hypothetical protein